MFMLVSGQQSTMWGTRQCFPLKKSVGEDFDWAQLEKTNELPAQRHKGEPCSKARKRMNVPLSLAYKETVRIFQKHLPLRKKELKEKTIKRKFLICKEISLSWRAPCATGRFDYLLPFIPLGQNWPIKPHSPPQPVARPAPGLNHSGLWWEKEPLDETILCGQKNSLSARRRLAQPIPPDAVFQQGCLTSCQSGSQWCTEENALMAF